jgi:hypothetical protein
MSTHTSEELLEERLHAMGPQLGPVYHSLWSHVVELHAELQDFRKLYGSPETIAILNDTAGQFFGTVQKVLWEHILLYVARLTDRLETCGHANLTLWRPRVIDDPALKRQIEALLEDAAPKWKPVRGGRGEHGRVSRERPGELRQRPAPAGEWRRTRGAGGGEISAPLPA